MSESQLWTLLVAVLAILTISVVLTLTTLRRLTNRRMDRLQENLQEWFAAHDRRAEMTELQRASIETRLALIEARLSVVSVVEDEHPTP